jgi:hypothetical protein
VGGFPGIVWRPATVFETVALAERPSTNQLSHATNCNGLCNRWTKDYKGVENRCGSAHFDCFIIFVSKAPKAPPDRHASGFPR